MPVAPGLVAMPTVIANTLFSVVDDKSYPVRCRESLAVISPMYNEAQGAGPMLGSLLEQSHPAEQIVLSINGGTDDTYEVVREVLRAASFKRCGDEAFREGARLESWESLEHPSHVSVVLHPYQTSKSHSVNLLMDGLVQAERVLITDGDTVFEKDFIAALRDNFYRLRVRGGRNGPDITLEDYAVQSGAVTSFAPPGASKRQRFISAGRKAEYAFATALRSGQARQMGRSRVFGNSRLYTVIGCGFVVRRDLFPMPTDTETEDHDFTLLAQSAPTDLERCTPAELTRRGFQIVMDGQVLEPDAVFDPEDKVVVRRGGNARFVESALMATEDPPHFNGLIRQLERWNGGGQQNFLKRLGQPSKPNVRFTLWTAIAENVLGLLLLALVPVALALNWGNPSLGLAPAALGTWLGCDALLTLLFVVYGYTRQVRAQGLSVRRSLGVSVRLGLLTTLPFLVLRYLNPPTYLASATRTVPQYLRRRRAGRGVAWERAGVRRRTRTSSVFTWSVAGSAVTSLSVAAIAPYLNPVNVHAWQLVYEHSYVDMRDFDHMPFMLQPSAHPQAGSDPAGTGNATQDERVSPLERPVELASRRRENRTGSTYCPPAALASAAPARRLLGEAERYTPLNRWGLITLARLAPLLPFLEDAATAYDVPVKDYLQILLNESYLDPLAIGDTDDKGLSQVTSDALTLLKALALDPSSTFYNPKLFPTSFSVFDPDFSVCAGAAKLAWARQQPRVDTLQEAYALYINPLHGFTNGSISERHLPLTEAMLSLEVMATHLADTLAAYAEDPNSVSVAERKLLNIAAYRRLGYLSLEDAYRASFAVVQENELKDQDMYRALFARYFGDMTVGL